MAQVGRRVAPRQDEIRRTRDLLRSRLLHGAFGRERLPGEAELMAELGAPRSVVRGALDLLRREGHVERVQGIGTLPVSRIASTDVTTFHGIGERRGIWETAAMTTRVLEERRVATPAAVAALLVASGPECLRVEFVVYVDEEPLALATDYVREPEATLVEQVPGSRGNWYRALEAAGIARGRSHSVIGATVADEYSATLLKIAPGTALLTVEQVLETAAEEPFNVAFASIRPDRMAFSTTV